MTYLLIAAAVLAVLILLSNILTPNEKDKKPPAGNCRNCPEFQIPLRPQSRTEKIKAPQKRCFFSVIIVNGSRGADHPMVSGRKSCIKVLRPRPAAEYRK